MIAIDNEFKNLIPPLASEEYQQLEANILAHGCRDALVLWDGVLIDGHNRYAICTAHNIPYNVVSMSFDSRDDAIEWIIKNQFGRRNLSNYDRAKLALRLEGVIAERAKINQVLSGSLYGEGHKKQEVRQKSDNPLTPIDTKKELAKIADVSHDTIAKVKKIEAVAPEPVKQALSRGDISINQAYQDIKKQEAIQAKEEQIQERIQVAQQVATVKHTNFLLGDCIDVLPTLAPKSVTLLLTDPPYGMGFQSNRRTVSPKSPSIYNDDTIEDALYVFGNMLYAIRPAMKDNSHMLVFCTWRYESEFIKVIEEHGYSVDASLVWVKENHSSGDLTSFAPKHERILYARKGDIGISPRIPDVFNVSRQYDTMHPTEKPVLLLNQLINVCTVQGELVVDPFAGTGATAVSCINTSRRFFCVEMDEQWHTIATARINSL